MVDVFWRRRGAGSKALRNALPSMIGGFVRARRVIGVSRPTPR
jgi:hypothetical protein